MKIIKEELQFEENLKQRLEFICEFAKVTPTFINGWIGYNNLDKKDKDMLKRKNMEELNMSRRTRREFTEEFKLQMVKLYNNGKLIAEIVREYDLTRSAFTRWISQYNNSGSFKACDNRTEFNIDRSLSKKGCPYDNAVAEATYKIIKTEFAFNRIFESFEELETELFDYVNWYNNFRIHSSLNYLTPIEYKKMSL